MLVTQFNPLAEFEKNVQRLFNYPAQKSENTSISAFAPQVNTREGEYAYHIDIDLPGVNKEDISIDLHEDRLTISGERNFKQEVKEEDYYKVETSFGKFQRTFTIPKDVDVENIAASSDNGVLEVLLPRIEKSQNKKVIEVK